MGKYADEVMKTRGAEMLAKAQENAKVRASEAASAGKTYQPNEIRKSEGGKYDGLDVKGLSPKHEKALKDSGAY